MRLATVAGEGIHGGGCRRRDSSWIFSRDCWKCDETHDRGDIKKTANKKKF